MTDKIQILLWFDEETNEQGKSAFGPPWVGDQDGRKIEGAIIENVTEDRLIISVPTPKTSD